MGSTLRLPGALAALASLAPRLEDASRACWILPLAAIVGDGVVRVHGRLLAGREPFHDGGGIVARARTLWSRWETDELAGATVRASALGRAATARTDEEGYFTITLPVGPRAAVAPFTPVELTADGAPRRTAQASVPGRGARFVVVSDIDDTALVAHATSRLRQLRTLYLTEAQDRDPVPGMAPLYRALALGASDAPEHNPVAYVSSCPANLVGVVRAALALNGFPAGPMFLPDVGFDEDKVLTDGHLEHKAEAIDRVLAAWPRLTALLFGDTGQDDPEVFERAVARHPGRIGGAFLRDAPGGHAARADAAIGRLRAAGVRAARFDRVDRLRPELEAAGLVAPARR
jgi:phosphatidate phosphatase APP1